MFKPMLFESRAMSALPSIVADPSMVLEQKLDGVRVMAEITPSGVTFTGAGGERLAFAAATQWLPELEAELMSGDLADRDFAVVFDGELMIENGHYVIFDMPYCRFGLHHLTGLDTPLAMRKSYLNGEIGKWIWGLPRVEVIITAYSGDQKLALVSEVQRVGGEGFMAKHLDGVYRPGRRVNHTLKFKFVHTADCIVTSWKRGSGTGSARLGVYADDGELIDVGGCSLIGKPDVKVGTVVEVAYSSFRGAMNQPRMTRVRADKTPGDCRLGQFPAYSKEVVHFG